MDTSRNPIGNDSREVQSTVGHDRGRKLVSATSAYVPRIPSFLTRIPEYCY